jgi:tRNA threonylcarbamoyladenosine biosynthesis protein TsaE
VSSPTFSIINEYQDVNGDMKVYHMDLYRIIDEEELMNIGFEDYLYSGKLVFIEWPQIAEQLLPSETIGIHIKIFDNSLRRLILSI